MKRHYGCIGQLKSMFDVEFEDLVLFGRLATITFEHNVDGREAVAVLIDNFGAEFEQECRA